FCFQAEDGIRDFHVTGVQTCALPILDDMLAYVDEYGNITTTPPDPKKLKPVSAEEIMISTPKLEDIEDAGGMRTGRVAYYNESRSEERRVGKERRSRGGQDK